MRTLDLTKRAAILIALAIAATFTFLLSQRDGLSDGGLIRPALFGLAIGVAVGLLVWSVQLVSERRLYEAPDATDVAPTDEVESLAASESQPEFAH